MPPDAAPRSAIGFFTSGANISDCSGLMASATISGGLSEKPFYRGVRALFCELDREGIIRRNLISFSHSSRLMSAETNSGGLLEKTFYKRVGDLFLNSRGWGSFERLSSYTCSH